MDTTKEQQIMPIELSIVMPLLNEQWAIEKVLNDHLRVLSKMESQLSGYEIVCLDDGSTDRSWNILQQYAQSHPQLRLLRNATNQGITPSFNRLFLESRGEFIYLTGADGQWPAENLMTLFNKRKETNADIVVGVRQGRQEVYTFWRKCLSYGFNTLAEIFFKIKTEDANGIKLGRREIFVEPLISKSFFAEIERLYLAQRRGLKIVFAPVVFLKRSSGKERGAKFKNVLWTISDMVRYIFIHPR
jgi:glycosyltransferase involved in cell wall biosynthesis